VDAPRSPEEPVWLVRIAIVLVLVGVAAWLGIQFRLGWRDLFG